MVEYNSGVDRVAAIGILRALHWGQHVFMFVSVQSAVWLTITRNKHTIDWPLAALTAFAPTLLRSSCQHWPPETNKGLSPPYALETGLPVATLLSILVVGWYNPVQLPNQDHMATWVPMMIFCPPAIAATLAFIIRGFRRRQTLGTSVVLVVGFTAFRAATSPSDLSSRDRWLPFGMAIAMVMTAMARGLYYSEVVASDDRPYAPRSKTQPPVVVVTDDVAQ